MRNALVFVALVCMLCKGSAYAIISTPHRVKGPAGKVELGGNVETSAKAEAAKKAKAKKVSVKKVVIPEGLNPLGFPLDSKSRIESLCGHELGQVAKLPARPTLDDNGNILITQRLKKPFRKCTQVTLSYSSVNHALYGIKLFSEGDKKMSEDDAWQELENMAEALKAKFGDQIGGLAKERYSMSIGVHMGLYSAQQLSLSVRKVELVKKSSMKGTAPEKGWVFTVSLVDRAMWAYDPESGSAAPTASSPAGADAL